MSLLGQRVLRTEDARMLTAGGTYVADVSHPLLAGAVSLHFVRSTRQHARIASIDARNAMTAPGVVAVFTGADIDVGPMPPVLPRFDPALSLPLLARDVVRYVGEPVAVVVADTPATAADAAELVVVEFDVLPAGAPVFEHLDDDIAEAYTVGDDGEGLFDACDVVVSLTLTHPRMAACPLETRAAASAWDADGRLHHWLSVQAP